MFTVQLLIGREEQDRVELETKVQETGKGGHRVTMSGLPSRGRRPYENGKESR